MAVVEEFLKKEKKIEEVKKAHPLYQETYMDKHPWQAAALDLLQEVPGNIKKTASDIGQGLQNTVSNIGATTMNMQPQYVPQTNFVQQVKPVAKKLPAPVYNVAKNTYNTANKIVNNPVNLMPSNLLSPVTNRMQGVGKVLTDVLPYTKLIGGEEYGDIDNFKDFMDEAQMAYDLGVKNAIEERAAKGFNVTKLGDAALDIQLLGRINPAQGGTLGANIVNGAAQFGTFGALDSLKNKGISKDLLPDTTKDAVLGMFINPAVNATLKGLGLLGAKALERVNPQNYKRVLEGVNLGNNTYDVKSKLRFNPKSDVPTKDASPYKGIGQIGNDSTDFTMGESSPLNYGIQKPAKRTIENVLSTNIESPISTNSNIAALGVNEIAPNIVAKQEAKKQTIKENLTNDASVVEQTSDTFKSYKDAFKALKEKGKGFTIVENPDKTYSLKEKKINPKPKPTDTTLKEIEEIAPNIAAKQGISTLENTVTEQVSEGKAPTLKELKANIQKSKFDNYKLQTVKSSKQGHYFTRSLDTFENDVTRGTREFNGIITDIYKNPQKVLDENYIKEIEEKVGNLFPSEEVLPGMETEAFNKLYSAIDNAFSYNVLKQSKATKVNAEIAKIAPKTVEKQQGKVSETKNSEIESYDNLDIKTTSVTMKSGKEKTIKYVEEVPQGWVVKKGAMTAPIGYTWYTNGKSLINGEMKNILVKEAGPEEVSETQPKTEENIDLSKYSDEELKQAAESYKNASATASEYGYEQEQAEKNMLDAIEKEIEKRSQNVEKPIAEIWKDRWNEVQNSDFAKILDTDTADDILNKRKKLKDYIVKGHTVGGEKLDAKATEYLNKIELLDEQMFKEQNRRLKAEKKPKTDIEQIAPKTAAKQAKKKESSKDSIQDSGEFLRGNRKTNENLTWDDLQEMNEVVRAKNLTKAKIYKKPTVEELEEKGLDRYQAALATYVYNHIAAKAPIKGLDDQKMYVDNISTIMDKVIETIKNNPDEFNFTFEKTSYYSGTNGWVAKSSNKLLDAIFPDKDNKVGRYDNIFRVYPEYNKLASIMGGNRFIGALQIRRNNTKEIEKIWTSFNADKKETAKKEDWEKSFTILEPNRWDNKYQVALAGKKAKTSLGNIVSGDFETREEAVAFAKKLYEMQVKAKAELKKENFEREYVERRNKDITSDELKDTFGFKGVNFGNYVNQKDRQQFLNYAYDSLYDLAELLNLPVKALSLNGKLGLAFGAQGHGGKAAGHYIPDYQEINMTRDSGAGTLAHEWWHAVDNYFGYTSEGKEYSLSYGTDIKEKGGLRQEVFDAFQNLMKNIKETPLTQEEIESRKNNIIARSERNIEYYANEVKNTFRNIEGVGEFVDNILKNKEKYMYLSPEEQHKVEWEDFGKLIPERRKTIQNMARMNWLLSEIERIGRAEELASRGTGKTEYYKSAEKLNEIGGMGNGYWTNPTELGARAFTTWLLDKMETKQIVNKFLARSQGGEISFDFRELAKELKDGEERNFKVYWNPQNAEEKARIFEAFDKLFNTIKTRETEKGVELYSKYKDTSYEEDYIKNAPKVSDYWDYKKRNLKEVVETLGLKDIVDYVINSVDEYNNIYKLGLSKDIIPKIKAEYNKYSITNEVENSGILKKEIYELGINKNLVDKYPLFAGTLSHEIWHICQDVIEKEIRSIPRNMWTNGQKEFIKIMDETTKYYRNINDFLKQNKDVKELYNLIKDLPNEEKEYILKKAEVEDPELYRNYLHYVNDLDPEYWELQTEKDSFLVEDKTERKYVEYEQSGRISQPNKKSLYQNFILRFLGRTFGGRNTGGNKKAIGGEEPGRTLGVYKKEPRGEQSEKTSSKTLKQANEKAKDYVRQWYANIEKDRYDVNKTLNSFINLTKQKAKDFSSSGVKISDKQIREIMPFLRERTEFPEKLDRPDLKKVWDKLSKAQKTELTKLADSVSEKFERYYKDYQENRGIVTENEIENHISHIWDLDNKKTRLLTNYFTTQSKFGKERTIETLYKGIQGFDTGNGEIIQFTPKTLDYAEILKASSDNLIKATHDMKLANLVKTFKAGGETLVKQMSKAPSDWVEVNHPALNKAIYMGTVGEEEIPMIMKTPVKVHPDIARTLQTVFETPATKNDFITGYDKLNSIFKQSQLGFSGFHMVALSESMLGNLGVKETVKILNPKRIYDEVVKGNWNIYKDDTIAKQAIDDGLQIGATLDLDRKGVEQIADDVSNWVEKRIPVIGKSLSVLPKFLSKAQKLNNTILWDYLHNNYKLECYKILCNQEGKNKTLSEKERREIAQWVNDSFGGQVWENLGIKPSGRRTEQRFLLSPDWLRSTTRQFMGMISNKGLAEKISSKANKNEFWKNAKELGERWGINSNTDDVTASTLRGKIARRFWVRSLVYSAILYNALNAVFRAYDRKKHPELYPEKMTAKDYTLLGNSKGSNTYVFVGRDKDGAERYLRLGKQFREVPEMLENPLKKLGGKASPNIQLISQLATGHTASGFQNREMYVDKYPYNQMKEGKDRLKASTKVIGKSFAPYSLNTLLNPDADWTPLSLFAPVSKGMTKGKGRMAYEKDFYNEKVNKADITKAMLRNNIPKDEIEKTYKQARTNVRAAYKNMYIEAIETGNEQKVIAVTKKLKKKGLSDDEINYIYNKAMEKIEE